MATTTSSRMTWMEPREMKKRESRTSPQWIRVSRGGAWTVLILKAKARRHAWLPPRKALQFCSRERFRCKQISACRDSGKPFRTWMNDYEELERLGLNFIAPEGNAVLKLTAFMSMPFVYDQACWKYSSSRWRRPPGIWWKRMNSLTRSSWVW